MKFKVGDWVKVIKVRKEDYADGIYNECIGKIGKVIELDNEDDGGYMLSFLDKEVEFNGSWWCDEELTKPTKSELMVELL